jgi:hypothetical protein
MHGKEHIRVARNELPWDKSSNALYPESRDF